MEDFYMAGSMDVIEFVAREALTNEDKFKRLVAQLGDSSNQAKLNTATSVNAKRQRAFRAICHPNQPSHVLTFARKLTDTRIAARIAFAFKRMRPSPESIELVCEFIVPATHSERRIGCFQTSLTKNARTL